MKEGSRFTATSPRVLETSHHESYVKAQPMSWRARSTSTSDGFESRPVSGSRGRRGAPDAILRAALHRRLRQVEAGAEIREHSVIGSNVCEDRCLPAQAVIADNVYIGRRQPARLRHRPEHRRHAAARIDEGAVIGDEC